MSYEIEGKLHLIKATEDIKGFQKREFVIETESNYPQLVKFEFTKDKCILLDSFKVGQTVKVGFNINGREWNGKFFVNLQAWRIQILADAAPTVAVEDKGDLPF